MTSDSQSSTRRSVLRTAGATLLAGGIVGLAGCSSGGADTAAPSDDASGGDGGAKEVAVGPDDTLTFDPERLTVPAGTTVRFVWESDTHNVVVGSQPDGADWSGTEGDDTTLYDEGHTHSHTFETKGTYEYYCNPHKAAGMTGEIVVE